MRKALFACLLLALTPSISSLATERSSAGRPIERFSARDFRGKETSLADFAGRKLVVVAFLGADCPLAKLYAPRLNALAKEFEARGVAFIGIDSNRQDSITEIAHYARVHAIEFPLLKDVGNVIADQFGAERTPEVFVLDQKRIVRYRGRIDDQYGLGSGGGYAQSKIRERTLATALAELLDGKEVTQPSVAATGCLIGRVREAKNDSPVTYSNQIARILQKNCVECHRSGQIAPFALTDYEEVAGWADMIEEVVREQRMPPWHADPQYGHFRNDRSLSKEDKDSMYAWVKNGAPQGDPKDLPEPIQYPEGWQLSPPEQIVYMADEPYTIPAEGTVRYQYFLVDPGWKEDRWIVASECLIGNRAVVHHIFAFAVLPEHPLHKSRDGFLGDGVEPDLGNGMALISGAAPGTPPAVAPKGMATRVAAGTKLLFQMHYTPNGSVQKDRTCVGFHFCKPEEVKHNIAISMAINPGFSIPPGADNHPVESVRRFDKDTLLLSLTPHMHLRGKSFRYDLRYADGKTETILHVPRFDFNWQVTYYLEKPKFVPAGTTMYCLAHFDNSEHNLANPDPTATVTWGDQTWEEMMIGWYSGTTDVDVSQIDALQTRTARFSKDAGQKAPRIGSILSRAAKTALDSDGNMEKLRMRIAKEVPQVDRVCVSVVEDTQVKFLRVAQPVVMDAALGRTDRTYAAQTSSLAKYAAADGVVVNNDLSKAAGDDLPSMSSALGSSLHVGVMIGGHRATVNFWSKEKNAFPDSAVEFLTETAKLLGAK
jgi:peroxiredoxin/mono/diheme cytochrome c family protein